jgi:hypothetical protein
MCVKTQSVKTYRAYGWITVGKNLPPPTPFQRKYRSQKPIKTFVPSYRMALAFIKVVLLLDVRHFHYNIIPPIRHTDKKEKKIFPIHKEIQRGGVAKSYNMRQGFLIYEEVHKYFSIYEEAVRHCN